MYPTDLPTSCYIDAEGHASIDQEYPSYNHAALQREYQKYDSNEIWEGFLRRARERGMDKIHRTVEEKDNERVPHPEEILWEVPCKVYLFPNTFSQSCINVARRSGTRSALSSKSCKDQ